MKIVLGILIVAIGLGAIYLNTKSSNNFKEWVSVCGYIVMLLGLAIICEISF